MRPPSGDIPELTPTLTSQVSTAVSPSSSLRGLCCPMLTRGKSEKRKMEQQITRTF